MAGVVLSLMGLWRYNNAILRGFDNLPLDNDDIDNLKKLLLAETSGLSLIYPDWDTMQTMIDVWAQSRFLQFKRVKAALEAEYNPIHNFDRYEEYEDDGTSGGTSSGSGTTSQKERGFPDDGDLEITSGADSNSRTTMTSTTNAKHDGHMYGNIGVTTSQKMIEDEINLRINNNLLKKIVDDFKDNFCVMCY